MELHSFTKLNDAIQHSNDNNTSTLILTLSPLDVSTIQHGNSLYVEYFIDDVGIIITLPELAK